MTKHELTEASPDKTLASYVTGFILSLLFTFTPYLLVVNHYVTGQALLVTILTFAMVQLLVQVTYFLHLGRGKGPQWNLFFFIGTFAAMLVVVVGSIVIINNLHANMASLDQTKRIIDGEGIYQVNGELTGACQVLHANHVVTIENGTVNPTLTVADKCDTVTFINKDASNIQVDFGSHTKRVPYAGLTDIAVQKEHTMTITLSQIGSFKFSDDQRPFVGGALAVVSSK